MGVLYTLIEEVLQLCYKSSFRRDFLARPNGKKSYKFFADIGSQPTLSD